MPLAGLGPDDRVLMVLPDRDPVVDATRPLIAAEVAEFEAALGVRVRTTTEPGALRTEAGAVLWRFDYCEDADPPTLEWRRADRTLLSRARDGAGLIDSLNLLHRLVRTDGDIVRDDVCTSVADVCERVTAEVGGSYPAFGLRGLDWEQITATHRPRVQAAPSALEPLQRWLAELQDAHTAAHPVPRPANPPYVVKVVDDRALFHRVPAGSAAYAAGVRAGSLLINAEATDWLARSGAPAHARPYVAGRRLIAAAAAESASMTARAPQGAIVEWEEVIGDLSDVVPATSWRQLSPQSAYLKLSAWTPSTSGALDEALYELRRCRRLIVDLRGNTGGNLMAAFAARDRFVRGLTPMGTIQYSDGRGALGPSTTLEAQPSDAVRWYGELAVLTDPLTYSASEDFLLGLAGLDHVRVLGEPTGGGSGRPRSIRLTNDMQLTVSTALTFDRNGRCIENSGIQPDLFIRQRPSDELIDQTVSAAVRL